MTSQGMVNAALRQEWLDGYRDGVMAVLEELTGSDILDPEDAIRIAAVQGIIEDPVIDEWKEEVRDR